MQSPMPRWGCLRNNGAGMIMFAVILGFPAVPVLIVGLLWLMRQCRDIRDHLEFAGGAKRAEQPPDHPGS